MKKMIKSCVFVICLYMMNLIRCDDSTPPVWPNQFSIEISEETWSQVIDNSTIIPLGINTGAWYYDYSHKQMRFDHNKGHYDNFCMQAFNSHGDCRLYFANNSVMYVDYPNLNECCQLCTVGAYCTVLEPNWLQDSRYFGITNVSIPGAHNTNDISCNEWGEQGAVAFDYWLQKGLASNQSAVPCQYWEDIFDSGFHFHHSIKFDMSTYVIAPPKADIFTLPNNCSQMCANPINATTIQLLLHSSRLYSAMFRDVFL